MEFDRSKSWGTGILQVNTDPTKNAVLRKVRFENMFNGDRVTVAELIASTIGKYGITEEEMRYALSQ